MLLTDNNLPGGEPSKPGIRDSLAEGWPVPAAAPFPAVGVSLDGVDVTGSRTDRKEAYRLIGGNRPFPNTGSTPAAVPYITCLRATKYQRSGLALKVPWRAIPEHERRDILEVKVRSCRKPQREVALYTRHNPSQGNADLDLFQLRANYGEEFWVTAVGRYPEERIASDYNLMKPKGLENTWLEVKDGLWLKVDGVRLKLEMLGMEHFEGGVTLNVGLGDAGRVKFRKDLSGFTVRMKDHSVLHAAVADGEHILLMHKRPKESMRTTVLDVPDADSTGKVLQMADFRDEIEIVQRPASFEGSYEIHVGSGLRAYVGARLFRGPPFGYKKRRGDIGEELINEILSRLNCPELVRYPLGRSGGRSGEGRPDSLRQIPSNSLAYFESKWWKQKEAASYHGRKQARRFPHRVRFRGELILGAYIATLDWNVWNAVCALMVSKVW
jgi:hypothetical protein